MIKIRSALQTLLLIACYCCLSLPAKADDKKVNSIANSAITSPEEFLGYPLGQWHLRHDQLQFYLQTLAQQSPRISLEHTGRSHEHRQQITAIVTSEANQKQLASILQQRQQVKAGQKQTGPLIIWLAYSIHGDEASGAHAALQLLHQLASANDDWTRKLLDQAVVLVTPSQNPDGLDRFATWTNNYTGVNKVSDPEHNEHKQAWPRGRRNHYFADLNRDWLFLRHPESQGRVALFHKWQPHYVGDFHEMGHNQSYFFQPGVPDRTHPLTPKENQQLTEKLADYHRQALDARQQSYFSKQLFDDFYYGKGSTYPDINGSVGVLFEQASARGQIQDSRNGPVHLSEAISNQLATSYSSLKGALALKDELVEYQQLFYGRKDKHTPKGKEAGLLISTSGDTQRRNDLAATLAQHQIVFFYLPKAISQSHIQFATDDALFIPINQPQKSLLLAMFDERTEFENATFYDVSTWNLAHAYNLKIKRNVNLNIDTLSIEPSIFQQAMWPDNSVALLVDWQQGKAAPLLQQLLSQQILVKFAGKPFEIKAPVTAKQYVAGSLMIPLKQANISAEQIKQQVSELANALQLKVDATTTSAARTGIDLGSPDFHSIKPIKPMIITGYGTDPEEVGQLWYYLDKVLGIPLTQIDSPRLSKVDLRPYSHVIMADGNYDNLNERYARKLGQFMNNGGVIIAQKGALTWLSKHNLLKADIRNKRYFQQLFDQDNLSFAQKSQLKAKQAIGGAIVGLQLDTSHPINFGLGQDNLPILKNKVFGFSPSSKAFNIAARYQPEPLIDGYLAAEYQHALANTPAIVVEPNGKGALVAFADNLVFRNIWLGSQKSYANALYFIPQLH
ncbi:M14 family zinc carboxypeptidase [Shewanella waksmanii]|uniref:M14 family zinc carboxypeptidase n=1 Tax=Shewanella waksmanii TaxID=213783 RepID=UPI003734F2F7